MSQIIEYFRSLFAPSSNNRGKRRRSEIVPEEPQYPIKYRRVSNIFPKTYSRPIDDDYFEEVKLKQPQYNELLGNFLMDQNRKLSQNILEDGEFSDEDELNSFRVPSQQRSQKEPAYHFGNPFNSQQPSTSSAFSRPKYQQRSTPFGDDNELQFVSVSRPNQARSPRSEIPPLIPISSSTSVSSQMLNGNHSPDSRSVSVQPARGRKSILGNRFMAFNNSPPPLIRTSVLNHTSNMEVKKRYDTLLKSLIPSYPAAIFKSKSKPKPELKPIQTIDLSDEVEENLHQGSAKANKSLAPNRTNVFKKPQAFVDLSDDEDASFGYNQILSSTALKSDKRKSLTQTSNASTAFNQSRKSESSILPIVKPINSLQEKQSIIKACDPQIIDSIVRKFNESRESKDRAILEEKRKADQLENERIQHERENQKRIDESLLNAALAEKCIILDEEEDVVDEFPPLKDEHMRLINFALHGPRQEIIISKFKMDVTRYDFATLDGLNWLNDMVINFYLELIKERSEQVECLPKVHVMNTVFLGKLLEQGYSSVRRWTRKIDIFSYDIIPVPVHVGGVHWCMSIIHLKNKTIKYYDSMGHPNLMVLEALQNYLMEESLDKRKVPFDLTGWSFECVKDCPQQKNGSDCGVFSCQFAEFISRDSAISFEQQHMPYFRRKMIYEIASGKLMLGF